MLLHVTQTRWPHDAVALEFTYCLLFLELGAFFKIIMKTTLFGEGEEARSYRTDQACFNILRLAGSL